MYNCTWKGFLKESNDSSVLMDKAAVDLLEWKWNEKYELWKFHVQQINFDLVHWKWLVSKIIHLEQMLWIYNDNIEVKSMEWRARTWFNSIFSLYSTAWLNSQWLTIRSVCLNLSFAFSRLNWFQRKIRNLPNEYNGNDEFHFINSWALNNHLFMKYYTFCSVTTEKSDVFFYITFTSLRRKEQTCMRIWIYKTIKTNK